jgi:hypothetical protein
MTAPVILAGAFFIPSVAEDNDNGLGPLMVPMAPAVLLAAPLA